MQYRNYVFDLYGTLVTIHTDETNDPFWERIALFLQLKGLDCDKQSIRDLYLHLCQEEQQKGSDLMEIDLMKVFAKLTEPLALSEGELSDFAIMFRTLSLTRLGLYPGVMEVLPELKRRGRNVILLTNAQECFTVPELKFLGIYDIFDRIFISSEEGVKKPSPMFFSVLERNGYIPAESVMIGNDPVCDCQGAADVGMDSFFIRTRESPKGRVKLPKNCRQINHLMEIFR